ncbi:hypothetical protein GPALN_006074 [Globodera pallida]|nr:hypothetical protein GPALN_006074 [Globodera pallida]
MEAANYVESEKIEQLELELARMRGESKQAATEHRRLAEGSHGIVFIWKVMSFFDCDGWIWSEGTFRPLYLPFNYIMGNLLPGARIAPPALLRPPPPMPRGKEHLEVGEIASERPDSN